MWSMYCSRVMPCSNLSRVITPRTLSRESRGTTPMKITRVQTLVLNLPMLIDGPTPMLGGRPRTSIDMLLVRVDTDGGVVGWGEAFGHRVFPGTRAIIDTVLAPICVGRDPSQIAAINDELQRVLHGIGRNGPTMYALSGLDIALWDIAGKA